MPMRPFTLIPILFFITVSCVPEEKEETTSQLGELQHSFPISDAASESFVKGLLLLHSFEYDDAQEAFIKARTDDPEEVMAYWGEAMTHYKALWGLQDVEAGRKIIALRGDTRDQRVSSIKDPLERDFWEGLEILYGEGELQERNLAFSEHMHSLYSKYEGNQEVAAFYALSLMWAGGLDETDNSLSAEIASGILEENPNHPGALHYVIHAYDNPDVAQKAEEVADKYSKVAPDATHALHMPSHIYLAMGMWNDVVASNEVSYAASVRRMERKGLGDESRGYHSYAWLHYGYLQQNRAGEAAQLLEEMYRLTDRAGTNAARSYLITMQAFQKVETGSLNGRSEAQQVNYNALGITSKAQMHFLNAMMAMEADDLNRVEREIDTLEIHVAAAELLMTEDGLAMCSAGPTRYAPNKNQVASVRVILEEMKALRARINNDEGQEEEHLINAVAMETTLKKPIGPPTIPYASFDMYGKWLLERGRYEEALEHFNESLARTPNRRISLEGKRTALESLGKLEEARAVDEILATFIIGNPDSRV